MTPNILLLSTPTQGTVLPATYAFFSKDYKPPQQSRALDTDVVVNQNGRFKYVYDNGPSFRKWEPFSILCEDRLQDITGAGATASYGNLQTLWEYVGKFQLGAPEDIYTVHWSSQELQPNFRVFPKLVGDKIEYEVVIQIEEG